MAFNPDIRWDDFIKYITLKEGEITGGYSFCEIAVAQGGKGRIQFGEVISLDFSDFDPTVNTTSSTALVKTVCEFANGLKCIVGVYFPHDYSQYPWRYCNIFFRWVNSNGDIITGSGFNKEDSYSLYTRAGGNDYNGTPQMIQDYGIKCAFITDYYAPQVPPTENLTNPTYFKLVLYAPLHSLPDYQTLQYNDLHSITSHSFISIRRDQYLPYLNDNIAPVEVNLLITSDLETLYTKIKDQGDIPDPFTPGEPGPAQEDDPSKPGGGGGGYDKRSDPVDFPALPSNGALSSGSIKAFLVSAGVMTSFFQKLWNTSLFDITTFQKLVDEPLSALVDLLAVPVLPASGAAQNIKLGSFDTEIQAPVITQQYVKINLGQLTVNEFWGSAMDYSPYTKAEIFLPFIGIRSLNIDDVMAKTIAVEYNMDILTGDLVANIKCGQSVLYKYNGNAKEEIPVSARVNEKLQKVISGAGGVAAAALGGGAFAAAAISAGVNVAFSKRNVTRSGDIQGVPGILDDFVPYLIIHRPVQSLPQNFKAFKGYPSNIKSSLSGITGYFEVEYIHLENINSATDAELNEIETLLKSGVII